VWVYNPEGKDIIAEMLKSGMAWHYKEFDSTEEYAECEKLARVRRLGIWQDKEQVPPWKYREYAK
jgi:endonuclease YncB( thermonuclease family)